MKIIGYITSFVVVVFLSSVWSGYALSILWGWFIVSAFHAPALSIPAAIGVSMIVSYMTYHGTPTDKDKSFTDKMIEGIAMGIARPALTLFAGWTVKFWL